MASKNNDSRKLYQSIRNNKGKISLFKEYIPFYKDKLNAISADKREKLELDYNKKISAIEFYLKDEKEILKEIEATDVKEKEAKLRLEYRAMRENNKREIEKNPSSKKELDSKLIALEKAQKVEIEDYKKQLLVDIKAEQASKKGSDFKSELEKVKKERDEALKAFDKKEKENNAKKYEANEKKYLARITKLQAKVDEEEKELAAVNKEEEKDIKLAKDVILDVKGLCMYFGGLHAVENLSFQVKEGEIFGLIGPNGAGKTTVFNCITQFYKPTAGEIIFRTKENDLIDMKKEVVHDVITLGIARTFQNVEVIPECTVLENMLIAATRQYQSTLLDHIFHTSLLKLEEEVIKQRAIKVLEFMGLTPYMYNFAMGLPYGILKKIEIARTLMTNPQLIILDEPAAGLNENETKDLAKLIKKIQKEYNCTILLVEHDMGLVMSICDNICAISFGKLLGIGGPKQIQANKAVQEAYLGSDDDE